MRWFWSVVVLLLSSTAFGQGRSADVSARVKDPILHPGDKTVVEITVKVHDGLHAQSRTPLDPNFIPFDVKANVDGGVEVGPAEYPPGTVKDFGALGTLSVYEGTVVISVPVIVPATAKPGPVKITAAITFQACDNSACFMPEHPKVEVAAVIAAAGQTVSEPPPTITTTTTTTTTTAPVVTENTRPPTHKPHRKKAMEVFGLNLESGGLPIALLGAILVGITFNAMPCVLPVVPLKIMGFYEAAHHDRRKSLALGTAFSLGVIASFAVLAVLIVVLHAIDWGGLFKQTWFVVTIVVVMLAMAIQAFGLFSINVPTALYSVTPRHDTYTGNFLFGILTAALSTPCTFAAVVGLLAYILTQPAVVGVVVMMTIGFGMALPYLILSGFPELARRMPRAGPWAGVVKHFMGFLLLAAAIFFAQPFYYRFDAVNVSWWMVFAAIAAGGVFLVVRGIQLGQTYRPVFVTAVIAVLIVAPSFWVVRKLTAPLDWTPYSDKAVADGRASGRTVVIDFTATWCSTCHYVELKVLHDPSVQQAMRLKNVLLIKGDVTDAGSPAQPLLAKLNPAGSIPLTAVYYPNDPEPELLDGIYSVDDLLDTLKS